MKSNKSALISFVKQMREHNTFTYNSLNRKTTFCSRLDMCTHMLSHECIADHRADGIEKWNRFAKKSLVPRAFRRQV